MFLEASFTSPMVMAFDGIDGDRPFWSNALEKKNDATEAHHLIQEEIADTGPGCGAPLRTPGCGEAYQSATSKRCASLLT